MKLNAMENPEHKEDNGDKDEPSSPKGMRSDLSENLPLFEFAELDLMHNWCDYDDEAVNKYW